MVVKVKRIIAILFGITALLGADQTLNNRVMLYDEMVTPVAYRAEKDRLITKLKTEKALEAREMNKWRFIADKDIKKCGEISLSDITETNIVDKVNEWLEEGSKCT